MDQENVSPELIASLAKNYRVLPLYEKSLSDYHRKRHTSLQLNKNLAFKWQERKDSIGTRKKIPFDFPHTSDFHFYNNQSSYKPSESINKGTDLRYKLVPGPGVDQFGDIPIPNDICVRSTVSKPNRKAAVLIKRKTAKRKKI